MNWVTSWSAAVVAAIVTTWTLTASASGAHGQGRDERVQAVVAVKAFDDQHYLVCATKKGLIKKTVLSKYSHPLKGGIKAILLEDGDALIEAIISDGTQDMILAKKKGLAVRFHESEVRATGRTSYGVKAVTLDDAEDERLQQHRFSH